MSTPVTIEWTNEDRTYSGHYGLLDKHEIGENQLVHHDEDGAHINLCDKEGKMFSIPFKNITALVADRDE